MEYELFGISPIGKLEFLGSFIKERQLFTAAEDYKCLGYRNVKFCTWKQNPTRKNIVSYPSMWLD